MEHNCIKAPLEMRENEVNLDLESFESIDFNNLDLLFTLPFSPLSPSTSNIEMHISTQEDLQLSSLPSEFDQTNGLGMPDTKTNDRGNSSREKATKHHHKDNTIGSRPRAKKRGYTDENLAELAATNPKKAKRIVSNRMAATRSKEKRERQVTQIEKKLESLLMKKKNLDKELEEEENEYKDIEAENNLRKIEIETKTQEAKAKQAFIKVVKEQKQSFRILIEQNDAFFGNNSSSGGLVSQYSSELAPQQFPNNIQPQLQEVPQQPQLCVPPPMPLLPPPSPPPFGEPFSEHFFSLDFLK